MEQRQPETQGSTWSWRRASCSDWRTEEAEWCDWSEWSCVRETFYTEWKGGECQRRIEKTEWGRTTSDRWTSWHTSSPQWCTTHYPGNAWQQRGTSSSDNGTVWPQWQDSKFDDGRESTIRHQEEVPNEASPPALAEESVGEDISLEASRDHVALTLLGGPLPLNGHFGATVACGTWKYVIHDEQRRCFAGLLRSAISKHQAAQMFERVQRGVSWQPQQQGDWGRTSRKTAWTVRPECRCNYRYNSLEVEAQAWPDWMEDLLSIIMPLCGVQNMSDWPNSCNFNLYEDGWAFLPWQKNDEHLFQGAHRDCGVVSLSLGQPRVFEMYAPALAPDARETTCQVVLGDGDVCTMEGLFQKHYLHRIPYDGGDLGSWQGRASNGPHINLTWRWIVSHEQHCPLHKPPAAPADVEAASSSSGSRALDPQEETEIANTVAEDVSNGPCVHERAARRPVCCATGIWRMLFGR